MQQRNRRLAILLGGSLFAALGVLAACSTDNGTTPLPGAGTDAGRDSTKGDDEEPGEDEDGGDTPTDGGTPDCSAGPKLRSIDKGFFCAFFTRDASAPGAADASANAGGNRNCGHEETCCNPGRGAMVSSRLVLRVDPAQHEGRQQRPDGVRRPGCGQRQRVGGHRQHHVGVQRQEQLRRGRELLPLHVGERRAERQGQPRAAPGRRRPEGVRRAPVVQAGRHALLGGVRVRRDPALQPHGRQLLGQPEVHAVLGPLPRPRRLPLGARPRST